MAGKKKNPASRRMVQANNNSLLNAVSASSTRKVGPQIRSTLGGSGLRVTNEEWLATVGSGQKYLLGLGPGTTTLSWIKRVASCYSKYRVHSMEISYVSTVGGFADGAIAMGAFYEAADAQYWINNLGYQSLLMGTGSVTGPTYGQTLGHSYGEGTLTLKIDCNKAHMARPWYLVAEETGDVAEENQVNFAYVGWTPIGVAGGSNPGNLICRYDIEFIDPVGFSAVPSVNPMRRLACPLPKWWLGDQSSWDAFTRYNPGACPPVKPDPTPGDETEANTSAEGDRQVQDQ